MSNRTWVTGVFILTLTFLWAQPTIAAPTGKYAEVLARLAAIQKKHPQFSRIFSIGTNDYGEEIYAIRISTTPERMNPQKIGHILVSTHHGNEPDTPIFTLSFIENLLERYSSSELWRGKLADTEYSIIPVLNISGYNAGTRYEGEFDPNRDYPGPCNTHATGQLGSVRRLMAFLGSRSFAGSVTVHGYITSLTFPFGFFTDNYHTHDHNQYLEITKKAVEHNGYPYGNGAELVYPANGCYEDYVYWKYGTWSVLLEIESGTATDIQRTVPAIATFFDLIDRSPSAKNQVTGMCRNAGYPDLRLE
jgi:hypothetical protein